MVDQRARRMVIGFAIAWRASVGLALGASACAFLSAPAAAAPSPFTSGPNLIVNGDAEAGAASTSGYDAVTIPGWHISGLPTVVRYGQHADGYTGTAGSLRSLTVAGPFPTPTTPGPPQRGTQLFVGGMTGSDTLSQTVPLAKQAAAIDAGKVRYTLAGWLGGNGADGSEASLTVTFETAGGAALGGTTIGPVTPADRALTTELLERSETGTIPVHTRKAVIVLSLIDGTAPNVALVSDYNNAYADNLSLRISAPVAAPAPAAPPASTIGRLDHVFVVYMENEGDGDIVGSSAAPYINRLLRKYGFASNDHGIEHPSDPNYIALAGGQTFGINDDCGLSCTVNARNLMDNIEAAHKTWKFYEQTMPSPCYHGDAGPNPTGAASYYAPDELPWAYFSDLADNSTRCDAHVLPIGQLSDDLVSTSTTPNFVWFEADDYDDMEQGGIGPGDTWLSQTVPLILNSPAFRLQRSAVFITWDEDNNNKGLNIDNQDQRVPLIVIPSPHSGMLQGHLTNAVYYTHYSLLRTMELALGLPTLTDNDRFATPLNGFWPAVPVLSGVRIRRPKSSLSARPTAATVSYRDSETARTTLVLFRVIGRHVKRLGELVHADVAGHNRVRLDGRLGKRLLAPGRYLVRITARNAAGVAAAPITIRLSLRT